MIPGPRPGSMGGEATRCRSGKRRIRKGFRLAELVRLTQKRRRYVFGILLAITKSPSSFCKSRFCFWAAHPEAKSVFLCPMLGKRPSQQLLACSPSQEVGHFPANHILGNLLHATGIGAGSPSGSRAWATSQVQPDGPQSHGTPLRFQSRSEQGQTRHAQHARQMHRPAVGAHPQTCAQKQLLQDIQ